MITGLGDSTATIYIYIENRPPLPFYQQLFHVYPLKSGELYSIAQQTGNHWRKIFNVYSKFYFELMTESSSLENSKISSWQQYRDESLLQKDSNQCLVFSPPMLNKADLNANDKIHIIMGKTYANKLGFSDQCFWLSTDFAINEEKRLIICPYFDYRQLSNIKITQLCKLVKTLENQQL